MNDPRTIAAKLLEDDDERRADSDPPFKPETDDLDDPKDYIMGAFALPKSIALVGRRWFQRWLGSTYNTCEIWVDDKLVHTTPMQYGYGEGYVENGVRWLEDNLIIPRRKRYSNGGADSHWQHIRDNLGIEYTYYAFDVKRQRDL